jgi:hypothetical protein
MKLIAGVIATLLNLCFSLFAGLPPDVGEGSFVKMMEIFAGNTAGSILKALYLYSFFRVRTAIFV